ncbi:hypothetical protein RHSIM_Rhsim07G0251300 [Rhododendron simsii]|uniref:Uncharacterized protein n=1 Tax=Rhododendron simsii TaxID=118357 RepID=A0A834GRN0_RHOSS|nr:hypothetical protein RHSIM_Rhsim07G0251300 [Rhododendron simsii]
MAECKIMGLGTLVMMPLIGNLSDTYGRKSMLTVPMCLTIIPLAILACSREKSYFYAYYVLKTLISMVCEGSVHCLALAYVVSASVAAIATLYMRVLLPESMADEIRRNSKEEEVSISLLDEDRNSRKNQVRAFKTIPSFDDTVSLLRTSLTFSQAAIVAFFTSIGDVGLHSALLGPFLSYISQMVLMPILAPAIGEEKLLSMGLFFSCTHMLLHSIAWAPWVPYAAAMISLLAVFAHPCIRSIVSKQVGPSEQAQGCISGLCSFANAVSPFAFSPLTGFSIACAGFAVMIAFVQSIMIRAVHPISSSKVSNYSCVAEP